MLGTVVAARATGTRRGKHGHIPSRSAIGVAGLRKSFGEQVVLDGIDLEVAEGTVLALLGPNGAGKTTMVQILTTLIGADAGEVAVGGHDLAQDPEGVREVIGVTGQLTAVDNLLSPRRTCSDGRPGPPGHGSGPTGGRPSCWSRSTWPRRPASRPVPTRGMRRRLDGHGPDRRPDRLPGRARRPGPAQPPHHVAAHPRPVAGGATIFLTTQYLEEADQLADRVAARPRPADRPGHPRRAQAPHPRRPHPAPVRLPDGLEVAARTLGAAGRDDEALTLQVPSDASVTSLRALLERLDDQSIQVDSLSVHTPDLDDVFLTLTGQPANDDDKELAR